MERLFQKPIEWVIAVQLERFYTKEEIVNMYLNKFDFLYNAVGIQSAAQIYFNTTPDKLSIEQAATLIGMCKIHLYFNPVRQPERTRGRRNTVLEQMYKSDYITREERDSLQALPLKLYFNRVDHKEGLAPYFREHLRLMMTAKNRIEEITEDGRDKNLSMILSLGKQILFSDGVKKIGKQTVQNIISIQMG